MTWVVAVLVVLVLGGIALVAAGRGGPLAPVWDDRPDPDLPETGELSAHDLRAVRFPLALRGYRMDEVDALLDRLADERETREQSPVQETGAGGSGAAAAPDRPGPQPPTPAT